MDPDQQGIEALNAAAPPLSVRTAYTRWVAGARTQLRLLTSAQLEEVRAAGQRARRAAAEEAATTDPSIRQAVGDAIKALPPETLAAMLNGSVGADLDAATAVDRALILWGETDFEGSKLKPSEELPGWVVEAIAAQVRKDNTRPTGTSGS